MFARHYNIVMILNADITAIAFYNGPMWVPGAVSNVLSK